MVILFKRFWRWLVDQQPQTLGVPYERVILLREESYQIGLLHGRQALARELELMFPPGHAVTAEDAANVKARQVH